MSDDRGRGFGYDEHFDHGAADEGFSTWGHDRPGPEAVGAPGAR